MSGRQGGIDLHTHIFPRGWEDFAARFGGDRWPRLVGDPGAACKLYVGETFNRTLTPHAFDPARRIEDMDRTGIARQLLSPAPPTFCYWAPGPAAAEWCRMVNDAIAAAVSRHPDRFLGAGGLPLQAPDLAVKELERVAISLRFPAVEIGASVEGRDLDDASLDPVWEAAAALGVAVFVHPQAPILGNDRFRKNNLTQVAGFPLETALAMTRVIFGGVLDRRPALRWLFAHGGGAFAFTLGRVDNAWRHRDIIRQDCPNLPSSYTDRFYVDSAVFDEKALKLLVDVMGSERVMLGSDHPFPLGEQQIGALVGNAGFLDDAGRQRILAGNARHFFNLT